MGFAPFPKFLPQLRAKQFRIVLSCIYLALYGQNACVCRCLCVCVCVCVCLRLVSRDKILRFKNTLIIIYYYHIPMVICWRSFGGLLLEDLCMFCIVFLK